MEDRVVERTEESAAEVLARLERYVAARRAVPSESANRSGIGSVQAPAPAAIDAVDPAAVQSRHRRFVAEVAPALIAVTICSFIILLSEWFDTGVAVFVGAALALVGVTGLVRRVPLARAYTFGLVVAALLIRLS